MADDQLIRLIEKYLSEDCTAGEKLQVEEWYDSLENKNLKFLNNDPALIHRAEIRSIIAIRKKIAGEKPGRIFRINRTWLQIAAAGFLFIGIGSYLLVKRQSTQQQIALNKGENISPGGNKAVLILANGRQIILTGLKNGRLASEENTIISKTKDGQLAYQESNHKNNSGQSFNTITTPRGGQYAVVLSDGTKVELNAASSLKYPIAFSGTSRQVELTGEAYFEVAHDVKKTFRVISKGQTVEVLGTHFNINAYADELGTKTDLLEGSVRVTENGHAALLKPGEESFITPGKPGINISAADVSLAVAWKNGVFSFRRADLPSVMRQVSRWYDVQVDYAGKIPLVAITGRVHRDDNASKVLEILDNLGIPFKVDGRKITILQKQQSDN